MQPGNRKLETNIINHLLPNSFLRTVINVNANAKISNYVVCKYYQVT